MTLRVSASRGHLQSPWPLKAAVNCPPPEFIPFSSLPWPRWSADSEALPPTWLSSTEGEGAEHGGHSGLCHKAEELSPSSAHLTRQRCSIYELGIIGHVQVWGNTGTTMERNGWWEILATCPGQCLVVVPTYRSSVSSWHSLVQLQFYLLPWVSV